MDPVRSGFVRRALREPTLHFALLAAALFLAGAAARSWNRPVVEVDPRSVEARIRQLEVGRGRSLDENERRLAEIAYLDEQILAREARARQLDDDERIRAILYQKMLQILGSDVARPTDAELLAYFEENRTRYARRPMVTAEDVVVRVRSAPALEPRDHLRRRVLTRVTEGELAWSFGEETAAMVFGAQGGSWVGPHRSAEGDHWFRVLDRIEGGDAPALEAIREQVLFDCMDQKQEAFLQERIAEIRERYSVRFKKEGSTP
jgi:hypothetical protein